MVLLQIHGVQHTISLKLMSLVSFYLFLKNVKFPTWVTLHFSWTVLVFFVLCPPFKVRVSVYGLHETRRTGAHNAVITSLVFRTQCLAPTGRGSTLKNYFCALTSPQCPPIQPEQGWLSVPPVPPSLRFLAPFSAADNLTQKGQGIHI